MGKVYPSPSTEKKSRQSGKSEQWRQWKSQSGKSRQSKGWFKNNSLFRHSVILDTPASVMKFPMMLMPLGTLFKMYGFGGAKQTSVLHAHQVLEARGNLVKWRDLRNPKRACIIFVSHEWVSWDHADPDGEQLRVLCRVLHRLASGEVNWWPVVSQITTNYSVPTGLRCCK